MDDDNNFIRRNEDAQNYQIVLFKYNHAQVSSGDYDETKKSLKKEKLGRALVIILDMFIIFICLSALANGSNRVYLIEKLWQISISTTGVHAAYLRFHGAGVAILNPRILMN